MARLVPNPADETPGVIREFFSVPCNFGECESADESSIGQADSAGNFRILQYADKVFVRLEEDLAPKMFGKLVEAEVTPSMQ